jgi:hypothetical protein
MGGGGKVDTWPLKILIELWTDWEVRAYSTRQTNKQINKKTTKSSKDTEPFIITTCKSVI